MGAYCFVDTVRAAVDGDGDNKLVGISVECVLLKTKEIALYLAAN
jgi:hypothetical protein